MVDQNLVRVSVERVSKEFNIGFRKQDSTLSRALSLVSGRDFKKPLSVLRDIYFTAAAGENLGLIGKNGSGKSTLLRLIAGIYQPDFGAIKTVGDTVYVNGFGFGLEQRLTMKENIYLVGAMMGLNQRTIKERFDEIVDFADLRDFIDTKVYQFSSGMMNRLRFSVTIHCLQEKKPEVILLDEVFGAGGDLAFQHKAIAKMEEFLRGGATVILASHDLKIIGKYCPRALWLADGRIREAGAAPEVIHNYQDFFKPPGV